MDSTIITENSSVKFKVIEDDTIISMNVDQDFFNPFEDEAPVCLDPNASDDHESKKDFIDSNPFNSLNEAVGIDVVIEDKEFGVDSMDPNTPVYKSCIPPPAPINLPPENGNSNEYLEEVTEIVSGYLDDLPLVDFHDNIIHEQANAEDAQSLVSNIDEITENHINEPIYNTNDKSVDSNHDNGLGDEVLNGNKNAKIFGSLTGEEDGINDSDSEDEEHVYNAPLGIQHSNDSEDEVEINPDVSITVTNRKTIDNSNISKQARNPLADAMGQAILITQSNGDIQDVTREFVSKDQPDDIFGISYSKKKKLTSQNSQQILLNEKELLKDLENSDVQNFVNYSVQREYPAEDDEFEFKVESVQSLDEVKEDSPVHMNYLFSSEKIEERKKEEELRIVEQLKQETNRERAQNELLDKLECSNMIEKGLKEGEVVYKKSSALSEMHDTYSRGLGDQGILLENQDNTENSTSTAEDEIRLPSLPSSLGIPSGGVIEEGDEEEEERIEAEMDEKEKIKRSREDEELRKQEEAWESIETHTDELSVGITENIEGVRHKSSKSSVITYKEALHHFETSEYIQNFLDDVVVESTPPQGCSSCIISRPKLKFAGAYQQRDIAFCIAKCPYQDDNEYHHRILQTIYKKLTGTQLDCPRYGSHWESIGFQGNDPATDLRGVGMLSLLQLLFFITNYKEFALNFHRLSDDPVHHFPMACVSINFSLQSLIALRTGILFEVCNRENNVYRALNLFHSCLCYKLFALRKQSAGEESFAKVLNSVLEAAKQKPREILSEYEPLLTKKLQIDSSIDFTNIDV